MRVACVWIEAAYCEIRAEIDRSGEKVFFSFWKISLIIEVQPQGKNEFSYR